MTPLLRIAGLILSTLLVAGLAIGESPKAELPPLTMSKAVVCSKVDGYEQYQSLADASLTSDEKLVVYYRPINFKVDPVEKPKSGSRYRARFSQDGQIRRKGEKTVLLKKDRILEYAPTFDTPSERLYHVNNVGLKGLPPGDYEYDIILRDELDKDVTATQTLSFTIIPLPKVDSQEKTEGPAEPKGPTGPGAEVKSKKAKKEPPKKSPPGP